jgi:hypothetical protein
MLKTWDTQITAKKTWDTQITSKTSIITIAQKISLTKKFETSNYEVYLYIFW